jgi:hypothetical protein
MKISIPELQVNDIIQAHGFIAKVVNVLQFEDCTQAHVNFISGDKYSFDYLTSFGATTCATLQGNHNAFVTVLQLEFTPE